MINFKKIIISITLISILGFLWWLILVFNTFPKKFYFSQNNFNTENTALIVLTGGKGRIEKGIELFDNNFAKFLFISGVFEESELEIKDEIYEQIENRNCCIIFDKNSKNTIENAYEVKEWLIGKSEISNLILVSSYYHLPRSFLIFKNVIPDKRIELVPVNSKIRFKNFLFHMRVLVLEFFKVIYTLFSL